MRALLKFRAATEMMKFVDDCSSTCSSYESSSEPPSMNPTPKAAAEPSINAQDAPSQTHVRHVPLEYNVAEHNVVYGKYCSKMSDYCEDFVVAKRKALLQAIKIVPGVENFSQTTSESSWTC